MVDASSPPSVDFDVWPDQGVAPLDQNDYERYTYTPGVQPVAERDNWFHHEISSTVHENRGILVDHSVRHNAGGSDEIDLKGLNIGTSATLTQPAANRAAIHPGVNPEEGEPSLRINTDTNVIDRLRPVTASITARGGVSVESGGVDLTTTDLVAGETTFVDASEGEVPQPQLGGPASQLTDYPLPNGDLANSAVTVGTTGRLTGGGELGLGEEITLGFNDDSLATKSDVRNDWDVSGGGTADPGDVHYVGLHELDVGEEIQVRDAALLAKNLGPVPEGIDLVLARGNPRSEGGEQSLTHIETILSGDNNSTLIESGGNQPLAEYTNNSVSPVIVFIGVDNGDPQIGIGGADAQFECQASYKAQTGGT